MGSINFFLAFAARRFFFLHMEVSTRSKGLWALLVTRLTCSLACLWIYAT
jgi:hypothetical protein